MRWLTVVLQETHALHSAALLFASGAYPSQHGSGARSLHSHREGDQLNRREGEDCWEESHRRGRDETTQTIDVESDGHINDDGTVRTAWGEVSAEVDVHDGRIDLLDFLSLTNGGMKDKGTQEELVEAFEVFDCDEQGFVNAVDLRHVMTNLGVKGGNSRKQTLDTARGGHVGKDSLDVAAGVWNFMRAMKRRMLKHVLTR